jgi:DNA end-binding protein Ku
MAKAVTPKSVALRATSGKRTLRFGLVSVGIAMGPALDASTRVSGTLLGPNDERVKQVYRTEDGTIYERAQLHTAYAYGDGFVTLDESECPKLEGTDTIELVANLHESEVPSEWVQSTHLAWPEDKTQDEAYLLVCEYLRDRAGNDGRVFIGRVTERGTTKVFAIRWSDVYGCLVAQTLAYHAQVRWGNVETVSTAVAQMPKPSAELSAMAAQLFDAIPDDFAWSEVKDEYGEAMEAAIAEKGEKGAVTVAEVTPTETPASDLMAALTASLAAAPKAVPKKVKARK